MPDGILLIDKQPDWTSHDVVAKCRGILRFKKIGHCGTLDPLATGLLVLLCGKATKLQSRLPSDKTYIASFKFGIETDTYDITGNTIKTYEHIPSELDVENILGEFRGGIMQIPPMVSAIKIGGKKLYELARKGIEIERPPRPCNISELSLIGSNNGEHTIRVKCSAGTYIRSLVFDIGRRLNTGGVLTALRRTHSGLFSVDDAVTVAHVTPDRIIPIEGLVLP